MTGHGDETQAAAITTDTLEAVLDRTDSKLDVAIALTCHEFDFVITVSLDGYTSSQALVAGYWGYCNNAPIRSYEIGKVIDKWTAAPTFTAESWGNLVLDGAGQVGNKVLKGWSRIGDAVSNGWTAVTGWFGL